MRLAIAGGEPGKIYETPAGFVHTHTVDGGAVLNDAQRAHLEKRGFKLVPVDDRMPFQRPNPRAQAELAANREAASKVDQLDGSPLGQVLSERTKAKR